MSKQPITRWVEHDGQHAPLAIDDGRTVFVTKRHLQVLDFLFERSGDPRHPTLQKIADAVGYSSPSAARRAVAALIAVGLVECLDGIALVTGNGQKLAKERRKEK